MFIVVTRNFPTKIRNTKDLKVYKNKFVCFNVEFVIRKSDPTLLNWDDQNLDIPAHNLRTENSIELKLCKLSFQLELIHLENN